MSTVAGKPPRCLTNPKYWPRDPFRASAVSPKGSCQWYAVNTFPAAELRACANLARQGWQPFCPRIAKTIRSGRHARTELRPLFPGCVFVAPNPLRDQWRSVDGTFSVRHIIRSGDRPSPLPKGVVETMQDMSEALGRVDFSSRLAVGARVRFLSGPFAEMIGALERMDGNGRVQVLLTLFGRETQVRARAADLVPTDQASA